MNERIEKLAREFDALNGTPGYSENHLAFMRGKQYSDERMAQALEDSVAHERKKVAQELEIAQPDEALALRARLAAADVIRNGATPAEKIEEPKQAQPPLVDLGNAPIAAPRKDQRGAVPRNRPARAGQRRARRWAGKLSREVYPHYFPVPMAAGIRRGSERTRAENEITALFAEMPGPALPVYIYACRMADKDGIVDLSAPVARVARGVQRRPGTRSQDGGDRYLKLLCDAGLFLQLTSGECKRSASEYRLVPYSPDLYRRAIGVFRAFKKQSAERLQGLAKRS